MKSILAILLLASINALSQSQAGVVLNVKDKSPVAYAKIGIEGRGIGTVADENGNFALVIDNNKYKKDIIRFSCLGYVPYTINVSDYQHMTDKTILLQEKNIAPAPVKQVPATAKMKTYGATGSSNDVIEINGGLPGSEVGLIFNFKDSSLLSKLTIKFESCSVDTIFYRVNVYDVTADKKFLNILNKNIYYKIPTGELENRTISIDLAKENVWVKGSKLITVEQVRSFDGIVRFTGTKNGKSYARKASFAVWRVLPTTISMQVQATSGK